MIWKLLTSRALWSGLGLAVTTALIVSLMVSYHNRGAALERQAQCLASIKSGAEIVSPRCDRDLAAIAAKAVQAHRCEAALALGDPSPCPDQIAIPIRQGQADARSLKSARAEISQQTKITKEAVARAEARSAALIERQSRALKSREAAPVDSDGLRVYDAERLRDRWPPS